jgi:hypothetical protein
MILNGKELLLIIAENMDKAKQKAVNFCDHSKEITVREIESFTDLTSGMSTNY